MSLLQKWLPKELRREREAIAKGRFVAIARDGIGPRKKARVRLVQEWLCFGNHQIAVDGDFGPATEQAVRDFRAAEGLAAGGTVDGETFAALTAPMVAALQPLDAPPATLGAAMRGHARRHLAQHPVEIGGENRGPWVRLYMDGNEGTDWPWCAGFVTFLLRQACGSLGSEMPIEGSFSCDALAKQAKKAGRFVSESERPESDLMPGTIFLRRKSAKDWTHTGVVTAFEAEQFRTIEGNTDASGSRNGFEVCRKIRAFKKRDFIRID